MNLTFDDVHVQEEGGTWLCLRVLDAAPARQFAYRWRNRKDKKKYTADLKEFRKKRSLDANAYFWGLCGKLAAALRVPKEEIYRNLVRGVGDNFEIIPIRNDAVQKFTEGWRSKGLGWVVDDLGASKLKGYTNLCVYYGSSTYDTRQMSCLIDLIVQECRQQDIETMTPLELERLKEEWGHAQRD